MADEQPVIVQFPKWVYRRELIDGEPVGAKASKIVQNEAEYEAALAEGWE